MSATPDSTLANPEQLIADLQRQLAGCKAERDEALARARPQPPRCLASSIRRLASLHLCSTRCSKKRPGSARALSVCSPRDGERFHRVAFQGLTPDQVGLLQQPVTPVRVPGSLADRLLRGESV